MKRFLIVISLLAALILCGCSATIGGEYGAPINDLAEAVADGDAEDYLDVFEDKYIEDLSEYYTIISDKGLEATVTEMLDIQKPITRKAAAPSLPYP
ncbi:MAG: hypothetical protein IKM27_05645 [Clostridia bacterium]|nr:hypothetical protein [Clostridia bacterium]